MKTIYIDATELKAVRVFAAKQDIRYYLNGVLVQATARETRIVATDGAMLGLFDREQENEDVVFEEFIVPNDVIDALKPDAKFPVRIVIENGQHRIQQYDDRAFTFKPVDGHFPDYRRVIPEKASGEAAQFTGELLGKADKAQKLISKGQSAHIWPDGPDGSAMFGLYGAGRFIGVIMPRHFTEKNKALPVPDTSSFRRGLNTEKAPATQPDTAEELL
jgi:DNA polymerase sliding clamp subunit (PCNA homolog)